MHLHNNIYHEEFYKNEVFNKKDVLENVKCVQLLDSFSEIRILIKHKYENIFFRCDLTFNDLCG